MPHNPQREATDSPEPRDSIADMVGLPPGQWRALQDSPPAAPVRSGRLRTVLSWLLQAILDGSAAYGSAMYPCFEDPNDLSDLFGLRLGKPVEQETLVPPEQSPWHLETLAPRHRYADEGGRAGR